MKLIGLSTDGVVLLPSSDSARITLIAMMKRLGIRRKTLGHGIRQPDRPSFVVPSGHSDASHETPRSRSIFVCIKGFSGYAPDRAAVVQNGNSSRNHELMR